MEREPHMTRVTVTDVSVSYRDRVAVEGVSLDVEQGHWIGLVGPNGAGKSTLLRAVAGLVDYSGEVTFDGVAVPNAERSKTVALLPQNPVMPTGMTVGEYVLLGRTAHLSWLAAETDHDRAMVGESIERLDLLDFAGRPVDELSGGEAQRVALARALAQESSVLLLDEPTSALDIGHELAVLELVNEIRCERMLTVVAAMHNLTAAGRIADHVLVMANGATEAIGTPAEVLTSEVLGPVFGADISVLDAPDGTRVIVPLRSGHSI